LSKTPGRPQKVNSIQLASSCNKTNVKIRKEKQMISSRARDKAGVAVGGSGVRGKDKNFFSSSHVVRGF